MPDKTVYSGTDVVGRTEEVKQQVEVQSVISKTFGGVISDSVIAIKKWLGIITRPTRSTSPLGALESVKNLKFNKTMNAMSLRDGMTTYAGTYVDLSGATTLTAINDFFPLSTESPSADTIDILCGTDVGGNKHIFQRHFWEGTGVADNDNDTKYVKWGESKSSTISSVTTDTVSFIGATGVVDSYGESNKSNTRSMATGGGGIQGISQSFTGNGSGITTCQFYLSLVWLFSHPDLGNCNATLHAHSGTFGTNSTPGTLLATSDNVAVTSIPGSPSFGLITFTFSTSYTMVAGTKYVIVLNCGAGFTYTNGTVLVGLDDTVPTHAGNMATYNGSSWTAVAGSDLCFYVSGAVGMATDYYKGWDVTNSSRVTEPVLYVNSSAFTSGRDTLSVIGNVPSSWEAGDTIVLYRSFHDNYTFSPTYSTVSGRPPVALQQGNAILFSGGMGSTVGLKPIWSGYLNKTFFVGATNKTGGVNYTGTYVTEAEIKNTNGVTVGNPVMEVSTPMSLQTGRWFVCLIPETDDGERGNPIYPSTRYVDIDGGYVIFTVTIDFTQLNKRLRYLNVFTGLAPNTTDTTIDWNRLYYIERIDLLSNSLHWHETALTVPGYYHGNVDIKLEDWNNNSQESLATHLGHVECTSTTASFSEAVFCNNRLFIAKYYDYVDAVEYLDQIRYTDFAGNGKAQLNVLCNLDGFTQSTIEQGDPTSVQALRRYQDKLLILKDASCYYIPVTDDPINWLLVTVSNTVGCTVPRTAVVTPTMVIWCQDGEDIYGWSGSDVFSLGKNWLTTFKALTLATATSKGWYDIANKSYNFTYLLGTWYTMFLECPVPNGYIWAKNDFSRALLNIVNVSTRSGLTYVIVLDTLLTDVYSIFYFNPLATTDNTLAIAPYFKTAESRLDEKGILKLLKWYLTLTPTGGAGTLDCKVTVGSNVTTYSNMTKTNTLHARGIPFTACQGRSFQFEFNANATPATFTGLEIYELHFDYEMLPFIGDNTITT